MKDLLQIIASTLSEAENHKNAKKDPTNKEYNKWVRFLNQNKTRQMLTGAWQRLHDDELPSNEIDALERIFKNRHKYETKTECLRTYMDTTSHNNMRAFCLNQAMEAIKNPEGVSRLPKEKRDYKRKNFPKILEFLGLQEKPGLEKNTWL